MFRRLRSKLTYANVAASFALVLSLSTGVAYAAHEHIFSGDIVNGEVKRPDLAAGAVVTAKVGDGAITAEKLAPARSRARRSPTTRSAAMMSWDRR